MLNHVPKFVFKKERRRILGEKNSKFHTLQTAIRSIDNICSYTKFKKICCHVGSQKIDAKNDDKMFWPSRVI